MNVRSIADDVLTKVSAIPVVFSNAAAIANTCSFVTLAALLVLIIALSILFWDASNSPYSFTRLPILLSTRAIPKEIMRSFERRTAREPPSILVFLVHNKLCLFTLLVDAVTLFDALEILLRAVIILVCP